MIPEEVMQNVSIPVNTVEYIAITWTDLKIVALIVGITCMALGYAINELHHRSKNRSDK